MSLWSSVECGGRRDKGNGHLWDRLHPHRGLWKRLQFPFFQFCSPKQSTAHLATEHSIAEDMTKHDQGNVAPLFVGKIETQWTYAKIILKFLKYSGIEQASPSFTPIRLLIFSSAIDVAPWMPVDVRMLSDIGTGTARLCSCHNNEGTESVPCDTSVMAKSSRVSVSMLSLCSWYNLKDKEKIIRVIQ